MRNFVADFETTTDENDCRVWGFGITEIGNTSNFSCGRSIDDFMELLEDAKEPCKVFMHNLRFDGNFIINWLEANGYRFVKDKVDAEDRCYTALITSNNVYYNIVVYFSRDKERHLANRVQFIDSLKILNAPVEQVAKDFGLPIKKGSIDYHAKRDTNHSLTLEEIDYIKNDVEIVSMALDSLFKAGVTQNTIGTSAMEYYKNMQPNYGKRFPKLDKEVDAEVRRAYRGGYTYLNPKYKDKEIGTGVVIDCNSEYPAMMASKPYPAGKPQVFYGEYKYDARYPLYIISLSCSFDLKEGKMPTIQIKDSPYYDPTEYIETTNGAIERLILTNVDYEMFVENYDIENIQFNGGYKFKAYNDLFKKYMEYWNELKIKSKIKGNRSMMVASKKMMNALYGKFGVKSVNKLKKPYKTSDGMVHFKTYSGKDRRNSYTPVALFTTAYGRQNVIKTAQKIREWSMNKYGEDLYVYSDTDSCSFIVKNEEEDMADIKKVINIHKYTLGAWKVEHRYRRAKYIRGKTYILEDYEGKLDVTISGFPKNLAPLLNFDNFKKGFTTRGLTTEDLIELARKNGATDEQISKLNKGLKYRYVKGGIILEESDFTIK